MGNCSRPQFLTFVPCTVRADVAVRVVGDFCERRLPPFPSLLSLRGSQAPPREVFQALLTLPAGFHAAVRLGVQCANVRTKPPHIITTCAAGRSPRVNRLPFDVSHVGATATLGFTGPRAHGWASRFGDTLAAGVKLISL